MTKIQLLTKALEKLKDFVREDKSYSAEEIYNWVSNCVAFFASVGMNESIISGFMSTFKSRVRGNGMARAMQPSEIGPFSDHSGGYKLVYDIFDYDSVHKKSLYLKIAFTTADKIIENLEESERLIQKPLIQFFESRSEYSHIKSSLELMDKNFQDKNPDALLDNTITLLESIFGLEPSLAVKDLSGRINVIKNDPSLKKKFGDVRPEILQAFHNFRMLRNQLGSHKNVPIQYDVPFAVALSAAYLAIMFLQITMATGQIIK